MSNNAIKTLKRASFGCQNFSRFRKRFLLSFSLHPTFDIEPKTRIKVLCLDLRFLLSPLQPHHYRKAAFEIIGVRVMSVWSDRPKTVVDIREIIGIGRWIGVCGGCEVFVEQLLRGADSVGADQAYRSLLSAHPILSRAAHRESVPALPLPAVFPGEGSLRPQ